MTTLSPALFALSTTILTLLEAAAGCALCLSVHLLMRWSSECCNFLRVSGASLRSPSCKKRSSFETVSVPLLSSLNEALFPRWMLGAASTLVSSRCTAQAVWSGLWVLLEVYRFVAAICPLQRGWTPQCSWRMALRVEIETISSLYY